MPDEMRDGVRQQARALLARALALDPAAIDGEARLGSPAQWDSIGHMRLLLALEEALGRQLDPEVLAGVEALTDLERLLMESATA